MRSKIEAHVQQLVGHAVDERASEPVRASHARTLADYSHDLRVSVEVATEVLDGSLILDDLRAAGRGVAPEVREEARARQALRQQVRAVEVPFGQQVLAGPVATGFEDTAPLIRRYARRFGSNDVHHTKPIIPGLPDVTDAVVNPTLPFDPEDGQQVTIEDVGGGLTWDYAAAYINVSKQLVDFAGRAVGSLIDQAVTDAVDLAAEEYVVAALEAAGTDMGASTDLVAAEGLAGAAGRGPAAFLLCPPSLWPKVRGKVAASWAIGPHPVPIISEGATHVTLVGPRAMEVVVSPVETFSQDEPSLFGTATSMLRPFRLVVRDPAAIRVLTAGVGA